MALNNEDKKDVSRSMGKALANKVSKVTKDSVNKARKEAMYNPKKDGVYKHALAGHALGDLRNPRSGESRTRIK